MSIFVVVFEWNLVEVWELSQPMVPWAVIWTLLGGIILLKKNFLADMKIFWERIARCNNHFMIELWTRNKQYSHSFFWKSMVFEITKFIFSTFLTFLTFLTFFEIYSPWSRFGSNRLSGARVALLPLQTCLIGLSYALRRYSWLFLDET